MGKNMLTIENVSKQYNGKDGIHNINLEFEMSHIYAIVGPNGAGKTTLIKSICGIQNIDSGSVEIDKHSTFLRKNKKYIGYALGEEQVYPNITIRELLKMVCEIKFSGCYYEQIEVLLQDFHILEHGNKLLRDCSQGMKKKVGIAMTFLGFPKVILLDEPTNAVDTEGIIVLKNYILKAKEKGCIILVTSHVLDFVNSVADYCIFIKDGSIEKIMENNQNMEEEYKRIYLEN